MTFSPRRQGGRVPGDGCCPVFPGCHVFCRPATYHGIEPPPVLPSLDKRAGIEPALSLLVAGADLRHGLAKCDPTQAHQPAHSPTRKRAVHAEFVWVRPGFGTTAHAPVQFCTPALFLVGPRYFPGVVRVQRLRPLRLRVAPWLHQPGRAFRLPAAGLYFANKKHGSVSSSRWSPARNRLRTVLLLGEQRLHSSTKSAP